MRKIEFGINDVARVTLTEEGRGSLTYFFARNYPHDGIPDDLMPDKQGILQAPLWLMMHIFGHALAVNTHSLFVSNRIQIEIPNDGSCHYIEETDVSEFVKTL